ncbi:hypothetical protein HDV01_002678 [Terramyces sp. JEL0728]|nr:hypothetical protein HDV01_002678 [Terramyces sp. JEL0728]
MPQQEPTCVGGISLKNGLLIIMTLRLILSLSATFTGAVITGPIEIVVILYGMYGVWNELALHIKIFGLVQLVWFIISNIIDFVFLAKAFSFGLFTVLVFSDVLTVLNLYALWVFYKYVESKTSIV